MKLKSRLSEYLLKAGSDISGTNLTILCLACFAAGSAPIAIAATNAVSVIIQQQSTTPDVLDPSFNGFSYEKSDATGPTFSTANTSLINLMKMLGPGVLRFGGTSAESVVWNASGGLTGVGYTMTPPDVDRLAAFVHASGWKLIYTLNLKIGKAPYDVQEPTEAQISAAAATAAEEAAYVASAMGESLIGFEIGNEPDLFAGNGLRPRTYSFANFQNEWEIFASAILAVAPSTKLIGPGASSMYGVYVQSFAPALGKQVVMITDHFYAGTGTESNALQLLLSNSGFYQQNSKYLSTYMLPTIHSLSAAVPVPYRVDETNAFGRANAPGFTLGAALWSIDYEFLAALNHAQGVNFHNDYAPVSTNNTLGTVTAVNPLFYAMKLFSMAANGTLLKATASSQQSTFTTYAVSANDGATYVVLNNKDPNNAVKASITFLQPVASANSMLLTGPSLTSTTGTTLGGASIGLDGSWNSPQTKPVQVANGVATVTVPPGSALFLNAAPVTTSVDIQFAGLCVASSQNTASGPYLLEEARCNSSASAQNFAFVPSPDGFFYVVPQNSDLCLDWQNPNSNILQTSCAQSATQKWKVQLNAGSGFSIQTSSGGYCFNVQGGASTVGTPIITSPCNGQSGEQVGLTDPPNPPLQTTSTPITIAYDRQCIDVAGGTTQVGPYIRQHGCNNTDNQSWAFSSTVDSYYTVRSNGSQLCLDGSTVNAAVVQNICTGGSAQKWQLVANTDKTYTLKSPGGHWCLGIVNGSNAADSPFMVSPCNGGNAEKVTFPTAPPVL
jgi:hypothetical protein